jgi:hypothetical protein
MDAHVEDAQAGRNSGNSSEPHVHFQLMDGRSLLTASGVPFHFDRFEVDGRTADGVPGGRRPFTVSAPAPDPRV